MKRRSVIIVILIVFVVLVVFFNTVNQSIWNNSCSNFTVKQALKQLNTGDLILFSYRFQEKWKQTLLYIYQTILLTRWTHVGLIVRINGRLYIAESTSYENKKNKYGYSDLNLLKPRLLDYSGIIAFRKLNKPLSESNYNNLIVALQKNLKIPFEENVEKQVIHNCLLSKCKLCQKFFKFLTRTPDRIGFFCTEFIQILLKEAGLIDKNLHTITDNCSLPIHYTKNKLVDHMNFDLKLTSGYSYSEEIDLIKD